MSFEVFIPALLLTIMCICIGIYIAFINSQLRKLESKIESQILTLRSLSSENNLLVEDFCKKVAEVESHCVDLERKIVDLKTPKKTTNLETIC